MQLDAEQISRWRRDGYLLIPGCFSADEISALREAGAVVLGALGGTTLLAAGIAGFVYVQHRGMFGLLAIWSTWQWTQSEHRKWLVGSGAALGMAARLPESVASLQAEYRLIRS